MWAALGDYVASNPIDEDEEEIEEEAQGEEGAEKEGEAGGSEGPALSLWGMASALRESVKAKTAELAASIQETDWKAELGAFQAGLKEDSDELQKKTKEAVEHLPAVVGQLKSDQTGALLQTKAKEAQHQLQLAGKSLGSFGHKLVVGTSQLFDQVKDVIQSEMAFDEAAGPAGRRIPSRRQLAGAPGAKYSRFEADVSAMQRDSSTYCDEPEDEEEYAAWLAGFDLAARRPDIDALIAGNTFMAELQARIVPLIVDYDAFWTRYFYRLHKLQQKHEQFVQLTQRAKQAEEEEVGWGSDDEGDAPGTSGKALSPRGESSRALSPKLPAAAVPAAGAVKEQAREGVTAAPAPAPEPEKPPAAAPHVTPAAAPAAEDARAPPSSSPTLSDGDGSTGATSEVSQISGGTPDRWTVVSSPKGQQQQQQQGEEEEQKEKQGGKQEPATAGTKAAASAPGPAAAPEPKAEPTPVPAPVEAAKGAPPAAAGGVAPAAAATAAASTGAAASQPAAAAKAGEEGSDLSDFDVDDDEGGAAGAEEDLDENWGDDWE